MTTSLVVDAGVVFRLITPHPNQQHYVTLVDDWQQAGYRLCAPALWANEITSALAKTVYLQGLNPDRAREALGLAFRLGVQLIPPDAEQALQALAWTLRLRRAAAYDSFYLAVAESLQCDLWTVDKRLVNAVSQPWVRLVEELA